MNKIMQKYSQIINMLKNMAGGNHLIVCPFCAACHL